MQTFSSGWRLCLKSVFQRKSSPPFTKQKQKYKISIEDPNMKQFITFLTCIILQVNISLAFPVTTSPFRQIQDSSFINREFRLQPAKSSANDNASITASPTKQGPPFYFSQSVEDKGSESTNDQAVEKKEHEKRGGTWEKILLHQIPTIIMTSV